MSTISGCKLGLILWACTMGGATCTKSEPSSVPADMAAEIQCVLSQLASGQTAVGAIALACFAGEEKLAADAIEWIIALESSADAAAYASAIPALRASVAAWRQAHRSRVDAAP